MITILLIIYFSTNTFLCTKYYGDYENRVDIRLVLILLFGLPYFIFMFCKTLFWLFFNDFFQIPFFYAFYCTKRYKTINPILAESFEQWKNLRGDSLKDRIYKHCCDLVIKRANLKS